MEERFHMWGEKIAWILAIILVIALVLAIPFAESRNVTGASGLEVRMINEEAVLVNPVVEEYLAVDLSDPANSAVTLADFSQAAEERLDVQVPVALEMSIKDGKASSYKIELADNEEFQNAQIFYLEEPSGVYEFKHLYTNTEYFYRVTAHRKNRVSTVEGTFTTADTPRILSLDGINNVRDIGNWETDSGKRIKQGMLLRGTEMDAAVMEYYHITNDGIVDMLETFDIKTDMDLRAQTPETKDALGAQVDHRYYDMVMYGNVLTDEGKQKVKTLFEDLANPEAYPVYLHCTYGIDRTGTVCYLLCALLGVSREDCLSEYGLSGVEMTNILSLDSQLQYYEGETLKDKTENYLLSCGITQQQIDSIRTIFLGE